MIFSDTVPIYHYQLTPTLLQMQMKAGRKIAPPNCEHGKHVSYCLFSHLVAWGLDFNTPRQQTLPHSRGHRQIWSFDMGSSILAVTIQSTLITVLAQYASSTHSFTLHVKLWLSLKYYCVYIGLMAGDKANCRKKTSGG